MNDLSSRIRHVLLPTRLFALFQRQSKSSKKSSKKSNKEQKRRTNFKQENLEKLWANNQEEKP